MLEQRKYKRLHLIYYLRIFDRETNQLIGNLVDLSEEGLMIISDKACDLGETYKLRMILPEEIKGKSFIDIDAESVWCKPASNPIFHETGFKMVNVKREDIALINSSIIDIIFND